VNSRVLLGPLCLLFNKITLGSLLPHRLSSSPTSRGEYIARVWLGPELFPGIGVPPKPLPVAGIKLSRTEGCGFAHGRAVIYCSPALLPDSTLVQTTRMQSATAAQLRSSAREYDKTARRMRSVSVVERWWPIHVAGGWLDQSVPRS
jgi:hypothetical protein